MKANVSIYTHSLMNGQLRIALTMGGQTANLQYDLSQCPKLQRIYHGSKAAQTWLLLVLLEEQNAPAYWEANDTLPYIEKERARSMGSRNKWSVPNERR